MTAENAGEAASAAGVGVAADELKVVVTKSDGVKSRGFKYNNVPVEEGDYFQKAAQPKLLMVVAIGQPGATIEWEVQDKAGNIVSNSSGTPAKRVTKIPASGPAPDGITL